jgi:F420H(2)-dependent quinone reductase
MPLTGDYAPSPWEAVANQVADYERTDGVEGGDFMGGPCIILTSLGTKTGHIRKTPLIRVAEGTSYAVVGSMGGAPTEPQWVSNLRANPLVELQDKSQRQDYLAREVHGDEKVEWWAIATKFWPAYDTYQAATERIIPLFVLEPGKAGV